MNSRKRSPEETLCLPTKRVRVTEGRIVWFVEMGSGRASSVAITLPDDDEWRRIMEAREAVRV